MRNGETGKTAEEFEHAKHLTKIYGEKKAVDDLSLHIHSGEIYVDGQSMKQEPLACKNKLAYIPDNPDLYEFMTGIQFLNFVADIFEVRAAERISSPS